MSTKNIGKGKIGIMSYNITNGAINGTSKPTRTSENKAIIYCRVSDKIQVEQGHGLEGQEDVCRTWCQAQNPPILVERVFQEPGVSGSETDRKEFNNALKFLAENNKGHSRITHFVVSEASRISRPNNIVEAFTMEDKIKSLGVEIIKVDSSGFDDTTDEGHLFKIMQYAIAGYERKKIVQRSYNGKRSRMLAGYRPFPRPPLGYLRKMISKKNYLDQIDKDKGPIIAEGLKLFAKDILNTEADLYHYWVEKGLKTNAPNATKLHRTFPSKVLSLNRLFFYAGMIIYPMRDINEPVDGKHQGLISLDTLHKILDKLKSNKKYGKKPYCNNKKMSFEHPLRGVITCPTCKRKFTSWNTTKFVGKGDNKIKKYYPYYGCNNNECANRVYIKKQEMEDLFSELLHSLKLPENIIDLVEKIFQDNWSNSKKYFDNLESMKKSQIIEMEARKKKLEEGLLKTKNAKLQSQYDEERAQLDATIDELQRDIERHEVGDIRMESLFQKSKLLFDNPVAIWTLGSSVMKELLISVRFNNRLFYSKEHGLRTDEKGNLYSLFAKFREENSPICPKGKKRKTIYDNFLNTFLTIIEEKGSKIEAIHYYAKQSIQIKAAGLL